MSQEETQKSDLKDWTKILEERLTQITQQKGRYCNYKAGNVRVSNHRH
jgi:hypothetical protein